MTAPQRTREDWLTEAAGLIADDILAPHMPDGWQMPPIRVSVGFVSDRKSSAIAVCYRRAASKDNVNEIFVKPTEDDSVRVLDCLTHEMIHATDDCESGHRGHFARLARAVGLEGKLTATYAGDALTDALLDITDMLGPIPHAAMTTHRPKPKQKTRMQKIECTDIAGCGFTFRTTQTHIDKLDIAGGNALCPACDQPLKLI